jgi:hypothetical protein
VRFTSSVEAQHRKLGTSSVAAECLRVQYGEKRRVASFGEHSAMLDVIGVGGYASGLVFVLQ